MIINRTVLIVSDTVLVAVLLTINYLNAGGFAGAPVILKFLAVVAFATCMVRHINYFKVHKRLY